jgi:putative glutamine amidotransferase
MPVIAISPCSSLHDYEESVRRAGGEVRILDPAVDRPGDVVAAVDGILLSGGNDVLPSIYGEAAHPGFAPSEPGRDDYELELVRRAAEHDVPLLANVYGAIARNKIARRNCSNEKSN